MLLKDILASRKNDLNVYEYCQKFSPYLYDLICVHRDWLEQHLEYDFEGIYQEFQHMLDVNLENIPQKKLMYWLRIIKQKTSLVIALYDMIAHYHVSDVTKMLSVVADLLTKTAFKSAQIEWIRREKLPLTHQTLENGSGLIVVAMGKLGANELNFSSDIDICVFFDPHAVPDAQDYALYDGFVRVTKSVIRLLSERTEHGYVYRVDQRLRPDPASTKIAIPMQAAEYYYECSGQNWERAAWIKGRFIYGDYQSWEKLQAMLRPFIWRRNLDFAAIQDIHSIKRQIHTYHGHDEIKVYGHNVKLGRGGIREIELFIQTKQLIGGGRDLRLRNRSTLETLTILEDKQWITSEVAQQLNEAYCLFRKVEHRLQMVHDAQTHDIPLAGDDFNLIAQFCDFSSSDAFIKTMFEAMRTVVEVSKTLFEYYPPLSAQKGSLVFSGVDYHPDTVKQLKAMGFEYPQTAINIIANWHKGHYKAMRSVKAREILTELAPILLQKISESPLPDKSLIYLDKFIAGLPAGVAFFSYLINSTKLMDLLLDILTVAPKLAEFLSHSPTTFDAMMDVSFFEPPLTEQDFLTELTYQIRPHFSHEKQLNIIRRFSREQKFRIGVLVLRKNMSPTEASHSLTILAHICIRWVVKIIEAQMRQKYNLAYLENDPSSLCVIALGSVGAFEMNVESDLDLMMIYDHEDCFEEYDIDVKSYYNKLGKHIFSVLTEKTYEGTLYNVDMRLRPSGNSGPLVIPYQRFVGYQHYESHIWEKCALTKIYAICGHDTLKEKIMHTAYHIIGQNFDNQQTAIAIKQMREKLLRQRPAVNIWDIRLVKGGLFDLNFILQYLILTAPTPLKDYISSNSRENIKMLHQAELMNDSDAHNLLQIWDIYHSLLHIFAIIKFDLQGHLNFSHKIKQRICAIMKIDDFAQSETFLHDTYQSIIEIFEKTISNNI